MKKIIISTSILLIASITLIVFSNFTTPSATTNNSGTLLWKINSDAQESPSYLYGTIHLMPKEDFFIGEDAVSSIKSASSLTLEVDIDLSIKEQMNMAKRLLLPNGKSLKDYTTPENYDKLYSYFTDTLGIKETKVERYFKLKPFNLVSLACMEYYGDIENYEQVFTKIAKKNKLSINSLETIDQQFSLIEDNGMDMHVPSEDDINIITGFEELKNVYMSKDLTLVNNYMQEQLENSEDKELEHKLILERNHNWIPKLDSIMKHESTFVAVGAAHLCGEQGLIQLLREQGYEVTPINQ